MTVLRICFVGDSITNGTADDQCLGWPGRLCATERKRGHDLTLYNLGVRAETSDHIRPRWRMECQPRLPDHSSGAVVFAFGVNDIAEEAGELRCEPARSLANARAILAEAVAWRPVIWISPAPVDHEKQPLEPAPGVSYSFHNGRARDLVAAQSALAAELGVDYLDVFAPLSNDKAYLASLAAGDGVHPTAEGYARIAALVETWPAWRAWLDGP